MAKRRRIRRRKSGATPASSGSEAVETEDAQDSADGERDSDGDGDDVDDDAQQERSGGVGGTKPASSEDHAAAAAGVAPESAPPKRDSAVPAPQPQATGSVPVATSPPKRPPREAPRASIIRAEGLRKVYRGRAVVKDVAIEVRQGEVVGLLGPNGAGKTTTFYMVVGLTRPDAGKIYLDDEDISDLPMYLRAQRGLSYLPQEPSVFRKMTVENNLRAVFETQSLSAAEIQRRIDQLIHELDLEKVRRGYGHDLSGGERRRVEIARALAIDPRFVLLDEPFAGIDPKAVIGIQQIIRHLRNMGIGILITDHNVRETLSITDRAYIINNGEILRAGAPAELSADPRVRKIYLGEGFRL